MAGLKDLTDAWNNIREFDLRPLQEAASRPVRIALVGAPGVGRHTLANQMRSDPARADQVTQAPVVIADLDAPEVASGADLILLLMDATRREFTDECALILHWRDAGKKVLILYNKPDRAEHGATLPQREGGGAGRVLYGSALDRKFLLREFVPAILALLPDQHLALGRQFPLFRTAIAHGLIDDACLSNVAYALSTGIAEAIPVFNLPLNVTDMVILTKTQAFLVYKLGLALGFSTRWQDYVAEFGGVIGCGFLWRQLARQLIGLIPVWGLIPKIAVAYSGTFVVGKVVLQWYLTGRHISSKQIRALYLQAFARGRRLARQLVDRIPRPKLGRRPKAALPSEITFPGAGEESKPAGPPRPRLGWRKKAPPPGKVCGHCGRSNAAEACFCQYCGQALEAPQV
jgi:uncharacterized protein (DUF697 family)